MRQQQKMHAPHAYQRRAGTHAPTSPVILTKRTLANSAQSKNAQNVFWRAAGRKEALYNPVVGRQIAGIGCGYPNG